MTQSRIRFSKHEAKVPVPDLLSIQLNSFRKFVDLHTPPEKQESEGLYKAFKEHFPVRDSRDEYEMDFAGYLLEPPRYTPEECKIRGLTYGVQLKVRFTLRALKPDNQIFRPKEEWVFLGILPYMTPQGTFIINGVERVVINQLHRSPGILFSAASRAGTSEMTYGARVIPQKGTWIEFATDSTGYTRVYFDRKKAVPVTLLLRAMGLSSDGHIVTYFNLADEVKLSQIRSEKQFAQYIGRKLATRVITVDLQDITDQETGEHSTISRINTVFEIGHVLTKDDWEQLQKLNMTDAIYLVKPEYENGKHIILATLAKDPSHSLSSACVEIYKLLRGIENASDEEAARAFVEKQVLSDKRYDLGVVGRFQINRKLYGEQRYTDPILRLEDVAAIIQRLQALLQGEAEGDEEDHLSHRRVRTVGEQIYLQVSTGLARLARTIREKMSTYESEDFQPSDVINPRPFTGVINSFFSQGQLSQLLDQTNPLSELAHKRRITAVGPGGLSREHAGFEARDVHYSHYGRICPIETPEGANIGLINSLAIYARVNELGFLETPYHPVEGGKPNLDEVVYLAPDQEEKYPIAPLRPFLNGQTPQEIQVRYQGEYPEVPVQQVAYTDVAPDQLLGLSASLIPFLEHDDANRALMGSNMQRQAVPLLRPEAPIVGTGMEKHVARDSRVLIYAEYPGVIEYVDAKKIQVRYERPPEEELVSFSSNVVTYEIPKFRRTNENTCLNLRPIVRKGQRVEKGQPLVEGFSIENGELALGKNLLVAFMPWQGYNFEDAIVISQRLVQDDVLTSINIQEFEVEVRETKAGPEELTRELPNESEDRVRYLDENGIVAVGTEVREGDILVGKVTPKGQSSELTPEEKLLRQIFGERSAEVKSTPLVMPPASHGYVIATYLYRKDRRAATNEERRQLEKEIDRKLEEQVSALRQQMAQKLQRLLQGQKLVSVRNKYGEELLPSTKKVTDKWIASLRFEDLNPTGWTTDPNTNLLIERLFQNYMALYSRYHADAQREKQHLASGDELPNGVLKMAKVYVAVKRKIKVGDKLAGRHGNKGVIAKIAPIEDMPYLEDGTPVDIVLNPLGVPSRMNIGQIYEAILGWAGKRLGVKFEVPPFAGASYEEVNEWLKKAGLPQDGRVYLYDGQSGERFDQPATVGVIYMLKLDHMVDDKMHARSVGPYGVVTSQPLGGRSHFGGQRFGEMEVWALEAFGAANLLQEMLTIKSDDIEGRMKAHEAIIKGENITYFGVPDSFQVLVNELRGLALDVKFD
ncbi:MAG: DNA-directed RNA polymerase subunit beta [Bacteroidia bacterium]|nr:DNA-directed RNA polymerase subunit beta [Bacteroidia bacterium]MCX7764645.1 DNA-directed RNA polymerase subunit beta [Bacteroidia bacterium]MDW8056764.1 DNA-directed RNA polymerase subunit beta [Bacteroidia bacterium]